MKKPNFPCGARNFSLKRLLFSVGLLLTLLMTTPVFSAQIDFCDFLQSNIGKWWTLSPSAITNTASPTSLAWMNREQTKLRYHTGNAVGKKLLAFGGINICEAIFEFHAQRLNHIFLSLYNRGDAGEIGWGDFEEMLLQAERHVELLAGHKADREQTFIGAVRLSYKNWHDGSSNFSLKWSHSRSGTRIPEYITLTIQPAEADIPGDSKSLSADKVKTDEHGNRYLEIPMVDQGAKGYCAAAVLERIMKFFGSDTDQHIFAQMLETSAEEGTQIDSMFKALRRAGIKLGIKNKHIYRNDDFSSRSKFNRMITKYNRAARRANADRLKTTDFYISVSGHLFCDYRAMAKAIDPAIYKKMRIEEYAREFKKFQEEIIANIDQGFPVAWGVVLGMVRESGKIPVNQGGHMRIINGYNPLNGKVIYTDSWGIGHEFKEISWEDAWTITMFAEGIAPAN